MDAFVVIRTRSIFSAIVALAVTVIVATVVALVGFSFQLPLGTYIFFVGMILGILAMLCLNSSKIQKDIKKREGMLQIVHHMLDELSLDEKDRAIEHYVFERVVRTIRTDAQRYAGCFDQFDYALRLRLSRYCRELIAKEIATNNIAWPVTADKHVKELVDLNRIICNSCLLEFDTTNYTAPLSATTPPTNSSAGIQEIH